MNADLSERLSRGEPGATARALSAIVSAVQRRRLARAAAGAAEPRLVVVASPSFGGAGKTPIVALLVRRLRALGARAAIVGHGYGGRARAVRLASGDARQDGDEAAELHAALADVPLWLGRSRGAAAARALAEADIVVMDSGLGSPGVHPGVCVLVEDATLESGVFPAGYGRFRPEDVARVDLRWRHKVDEPGARTGGADVESVWQAMAVRSPSGERLPLAAIAEGRWVALSGIARPASFHEALRRAGARVVEARVLADHAWPTPRHVALPPGLCGITTAKDAARLPPGHGWWVLEGEVRIVRGEPTVDALLERLAAAAR